MKTVIVCVSVSHGNTRRVAEAMGEVLGASVLEPEDLDEQTLEEADLVIVGSGIYAMSFHPRLLAFVKRLPTVEGKRAAVFWTSGGPELPWWRYSQYLVRRLAAKGFEPAGTFSCRGWDTWLPLRLVGGLNKGRPDSADLDRAREFAAGLAAPARSPRGGSRRPVAAGGRSGRR
jgi:flavodoxin